MLAFGVCSLLIGRRRRTVKQQLAEQKLSAQASQRGSGRAQTSGATSSPTSTGRRSPSGGSPVNMPRVQTATSPNVVTVVNPNNGGPTYVIRGNNLSPLQLRQAPVMRGNNVSPLQLRQAPVQVLSTKDAYANLPGTSSVQMMTVGHHAATIE